jgi:hypothetical protein
MLITAAEEFWFASHGGIRFLVFFQTWVSVHKGTQSTAKTTAKDIPRKIVDGSLGLRISVTEIRQ